MLGGWLQLWTALVLILPPVFPVIPTFLNHFPDYLLLSLVSCNCLSSAKGYILLCTSISFSKFFQGVLTVIYTTLTPSCPELPHHPPSCQRWRGSPPLLLLPFPRWLRPWCQWWGLHSAWTSCSQYLRPQCLLWRSAPTGPMRGWLQTGDRCRDTEFKFVLSIRVLQGQGL